MQINKIDSMGAPGAPCNFCNRQNGIDYKKVYMIQNNDHGYNLCVRMCPKCLKTLIKFKKKGKRI